MLLQHADFGVSTIWSADELACPKCNTKIICNLSGKPLAQYWQNDIFPGMMKLARHKPDNVVHCYEFPEQEKASGAHAG